MAFVNITEFPVRVRYLQEMLRYLGQVQDEEDWRVAVTGTYNDETVRAVRQYQETRRLPVTGVVDLATWETLTAEYLLERELREPVMVRVLPDIASHATLPGQRGDEVLILQILLNAMRSEYSYPQVPLSGIYGAQTLEAVREYQQKNGLDATGTADRRTWLRLTEEYNRLRNG